MFPVFLIGLLLPVAARAWGPHSRITRAALHVLPERARLETVLGRENLDALAGYCLLPDLRGKDLRTFYADDYLLIQAMPRHVGHTMPEVRHAFAPYYRRALQALRTETPANACRQIGPLLHFVEDAGAPPHAKPKCPHHTELENWVRADEIDIGGYAPQLLGDDDDAALAGLLRRVDALIEFSCARAERALPLVAAPRPDRARVEPILLESALESARVTADVLHTVLTLGLRPQPKGARLVGTVTAPEIPGRNEHGAWIMLIGTGYTTLAETDPGGGGAGGAWCGRYELHNLPAGSCRVLVCRTAALFQESGALTLETGRVTTLDFDLRPTDPRGNLVENPDGRLSCLEPGMPDRWRSVKGAWMSTAVWVRPGVRYRCGASLKLSDTRVRFEFASRPPKGGKPPEPLRVPLEFGGEWRAETTAAAGPDHVSVSAVVECSSPFVDAIDRVWIVPAEP